MGEIKNRLPFQKKSGIKFGMLIALGSLWVFALWKNCLGIQCDEPYMIACGDMIARGSAYIRDLSCPQASVIFAAPLIFLHTKIAGSTEGVLLTARIFSVLVQTFISIYFYLTFVKGGYKKAYVLLASLLFFLFNPDFLNVLYKTEFIWFVMLEIIFTYRYYLSGKQRYLVLLGVMVSAGVFAYPTALLRFPVYLLIIYMISREKQNKAGKQWLIFSLTCVACALLTLLYLLSRMSLADLLRDAPRIFQKGSLNTNFLGKMVHPLLKYLAMGCMVLLPLAAALKIEKIKNILMRFRIPLITLLLVFAFLGQCYIERTGITWHCILYPYVLTLFLLPVLFGMDTGRGKNRILFRLFEIPAITVVICVALASNQGNITSMYGSVFSVMGFVLMLGEAEKEETELLFFRERSIIPVCLLLLALLMSIPVWDQETVMSEYPAGSVFTPRVKVAYGPAKGCKMGIPTYEEYEEICSLIAKEVTGDDRLLIVDNERVTGYGYLYSTGAYATYLPQGGDSFGLNGIIVDYYELNPEKTPTVVILDELYIGQPMETYLEEMPLGRYLTKQDYRMTGKEGKYYIFRSRPL